ncbi:MAG TPA: amidohydrolase family protein [Burkholderiales bacterium]
MSVSGKPGSIDAHAHWAPEAYVREVERLGRKAAGGPLSPLMFDLENRLKWMDERSVKMHVLTLSGSMPWQWASQDDANRLARIVNDAAIEAHKAFPDRFVAGVAIPMRDAAAAIRELDRVAGQPGIRAVHLPNSVESHDYIFERAYLPLLARCEELGYPLLFHPLDQLENHYGGPERLSGATFFYNTLGFPFETATTAAKFISTGLLDRFPKLEIVLPHSGGCFPYIAGRIEHSIRKGVSDVKLQRPFREYIRRFHYDTLAYYPETLRFMIELVGSDRVVIGTDNYAKMDVEQPNALVEQLKLPPQDLERILRGNAVKLFRL